MRHLALVLALSSGAVAQTQFEAAPGAYLTLDALDLLRLGDGAIEVGAGAGWRFANGLDAGVRLAAEHTRFDGPDRTVSEARRLAVAVEAGYTARIGRRSGLRFGAQGALQQTVQVGAPTTVRGTDGSVAVIDRGNQDLNVGEVSLSAAAFRRVALGRVAVQPTVGVFGGGGVTATADADQPFTLRADAGRRTATQNRADALGGVFVGVPVLVPVGWAGVVVDLRAAYDIVRNEQQTDVRLRVNL